MGLFDLFKKKRRDSDAFGDDPVILKATRLNCGGTILDKYRAGLSYLDGCGTFEETKFLEFNRIIGNRFSDADIENQLRNAKLMIKGMEDLKQTLRLSMVEAVSTFEELEQKGVDLSKYDL